jgi:hypothetical protein
MSSSAISPDLPYRINKGNAGESPWLFYISPVDEEAIEAGKCVGDLIHASGTCCRLTKDKIFKGAKCKNFFKEKQ